jgi:hypothetical protein
MFSLAGLAVVAVLVGGISRIRGETVEPLGAIVWDAVHWVPVDVEAFGSPTTFVSDMTLGPTGVIAWGEATTPDPDRPGEFLISTLLWRSGDGINWNTSLFPNGGGQVFIPSVVAESARGFLAHGRVGPADLGTAGVWSPDGRAWSTIRLPAEPGVTENLVGIDTGFVTVGFEGDRPVAWSSVDGSSWTREEIAAPDGAVRAGGLASHEGEVYLAGYAETATDFDGLVWRRSTSGRWTRLAESDRELVGPHRGATVQRVLAFNDRLLAIGSAGDIPDCSLSGIRLASVGPRTADHCPGVPPAAWISSDGAAWRPVDPPHPPGIPRGMEVYLHDAEVGLDGVFVLLNERPHENEARYGIWTTGDGERWRRVADGMPAGSVQHAVALPGRLVVVATSLDGSPQIWIGNPPPVDP